MYFVCIRDYTCIFTYFEKRTSHVDLSQSRLCNCSSSGVCPSLSIILGLSLNLAITAASRAVASDVESLMCNGT